MSLFRRFAAALIAITLVPMQVLAAMPILYCVAPGGHHALEFVIEGIAHGGHHASHGSQEVSEDCNSGRVLEAPGCIDRALLDAVSFVASDHQPIPPAIRFLEPPLFIVPESPDLIPASQNYHHRSDPGLLALRTVTLRH